MWKPSINMTYDISMRTFHADGTHGMHTLWTAEQTPTWQNLLIFAMRRTKIIPAISKKWIHPGKKSKTKGMCSPPKGDSLPLLLFVLFYAIFPIEQSTTQQRWHWTTCTSNNIRPTARIPSTRSAGSFEIPLKTKLVKTETVWIDEKETYLFH